MLGGNFTKLFLFNILLLLFFLPTIALIVFKEFRLTELATNLSFTHNIWMFNSYYPSSPLELPALQHSLNRYVYLGLLVFSVIGPFAMAGGFFLFRNFVWRNGVFTTKDFYRGIKNSYLKIFVYTLLLSGILIICLHSISFSNLMYAYNNAWYYVLAKISAIIIMVIAVLIYLFACCFTVTYKLPLLKTINYAFRFTFNFLIPNLFFLIFSLLPVLLMLLVSSSGFLGTLIRFFNVFVGIIFVLIVWTSYSQFLFDKVITGQIDKSYYEVKEKTKAEVKEVKETEYIKPVTDDVQIEQLPEMFSRKDLEKLEQSKQFMKEDSDKYYNEKKNKK